MLNSRRDLLLWHGYQFSARTMSLHLMSSPVRWLAQQVDTMSEAGRTWSWWRTFFCSQDL